MNKLTKSERSISFIFMLVGLLLLPLVAEAQEQVVFGHADSDVEPFYNNKVWQVLSYRNIGPYRGGRALAVEGIDDKPGVYYAGFTGGGVYKTVNGGDTWFNISDDYFKTGSVGAIAVSNSVPNVIYVGMGEACIRSNMSEGDGIYKSTDSGETWQWIGLGETRVIGDIIVHPTNPNIVWVAAMGRIFGKEGNKERGVFKSTDGGKTWEKVLYYDRHTGAVDLAIDPNNPRILYAALWEAYRTPWFMSSGGRPEGGYGSGIYKSTDGGKTWTEISENPGLPKEPLGKIGITVSPVNSDRVWAIIEAENGGVFRSDNGGKTWQRINSDPNVNARPWYYKHIVAGTGNDNTVYSLTATVWKSVDGGRTFKSIGLPDGDVHDMWIDPDNPDRMAVADDGGVQVSVNGGKTWSDYFEYATGEFYHVVTDDLFPYRVYGAQQDAGTVVIKNRTDGEGITIQDWHGVGGGESGHIAPDPDEPKITYATSYGGLLTKQNSATSEIDVISVWPSETMGHAAKDVKYRFQWTTPIFVSPNNPDVLYTTAQYVFRSNNEGMSWTRISPDLTRDEIAHQQLSGGPITYENVDVEFYNTIFSFAISGVKDGIIWTGADDGLVYLSRDNGETWTNVTPDALKTPSNRARINSINPSPFDASKVYIAATRYKQGNYEPLLFKSDDFGETWTKITNGIPPKEFTRVLVPDPFRKGLLFAGTETGIYISFNDGKKWQKFQLNLPPVPVTDMTIQREDKDLVISTDGRAFWILDGLEVLHQLTPEVAASRAYLFKPEIAYLLEATGDVRLPNKPIGQNPYDGVVVYYYLNGVDDDAQIKLQFLKDEDVIRTFSNTEAAEGESIATSRKYYMDRKPDKPMVLTDKEGLNRFVWNMRYPGAIELENIALWSGTTRGAKAMPGTYSVRLIIEGERIMQQDFQIKADPRITVSLADIKAQFELYRTIIEKLDQTNKAIIHLQEVRSNLNKIMKGFNEEAIATVRKKLTDIENQLVQTRIQAGLEALAHPVKLNNKLASLAASVGRGLGRPTEQQYAVYDVVAEKVNTLLQRLEKIYEAIRSGNDVIIEGEESIQLDGNGK